MSDHPRHPFRLSSIKRALAGARAAGYDPQALRVSNSGEITVILKSDGINVDDVVGHAVETPRP